MLFSVKMADPPPPEENHDCMTFLQYLEIVQERDGGHSLLERFQNCENSYQLVCEEVIFLIEIQFQEIKDSKLIKFLSFGSHNVMPQNGYAVFTKITTKTRCRSISKFMDEFKSFFNQSVIDLPAKSSKLKSAE